MARQADAARGVWPFLAVVGALALLGASASAWTSAQVTREVGGVAVAETVTTTGVEAAPASVVVALVGLLAGLALLLVRGSVRRTVALVVAACGAVALAACGLAAVAVVGADAGVTVAPWVALLAASAMLGAGLAGARGPGRRLPSRYDVDARPDDDEWQLASVETPDRMPRHDGRGSAPA